MISDVFRRQKQLKIFIVSQVSAYAYIIPSVVVLQVRLAIAEKGLRCEEYDVSLPLSEHNEPWFMHLNPTGEVPVLVHDENVICDPTQIMDYLEQTFNGETK